MNGNAAVQADNIDAQDIVATLKALMIQQTLPLWAQRGWDAQHGGFVDRLGADGEPDRDAPRRLRVQARQIFCFARAAQLGWYPDGRALALDGLEYLLAKARSPDGRPGYVSLLTPDGAMIDPARDTYDHAFVLLALATVYQFDRDAQVRAEIDAVLAFLDTQLKSEHGGYREGLPARLPRRQNPQMHLFEAMIALFDATHDMAFQNRAGDFYALLLAHFYDPRTEVLGEYFEDDWSKISPVIVEPGHQAEWVWLLKGFERITGCPTAKFRAPLLRSALRYRDQATGCLVDEGHADGQITRSSQRCWPQTELAKALIAQTEAGEAGAAEAAREALARLEKRYLRHPVKGGWYEHFDGEGRSMVDWIPASSLYHILGAVMEADRVLT
ncbi:MAG: mannose-6-phosphate isomerase [Rhizobiales bacterium 62-47]|nr:AGE family epimerase/isomerase [Hyphomicrobiales bacterium]OJY09485.1 MAG: mannose-6-phosphate isomerase [Rhizobiales bacterium 62-47]